MVVAKQVERTMNSEELKFRIDQMAALVGLCFRTRVGNEDVSQIGFPGFGIRFASWD